MRLLRPPFVLALFALLLTASCKDSFSPFDVAGTYALRDIAGDALPALRYRNSDWGVRAISGTLRLRANGRGTLSSVSESVIPPGGVTRDSWEVSLRFVTRGDRIEITFDCPPNAGCIEGPHLIGKRSARSLIMEYALNERVPQRYARTSDAR